MIKYIRGDATSPQAAGPKVIAHICNDRGGWGKGFVLALSKKWREPERQYRSWYASREGFALGAIQLVQVLPDTWVCNMVAQNGFKTGSKGPPIRYPSLRKCLEQLADEAKTLRASIHMPKIGTGLAGGRWDEIEPMIEGAMKDLSVFVYVLE